MVKESISEYPPTRITARDDCASKTAEVDGDRSPAGAGRRGPDGSGGSSARGGTGASRRTNQCVSRLSRVEPSNIPVVLFGSSRSGVRTFVPVVETLRSRFGHSQGVDTASSDADCLARSLHEPTAFELIFDRHFGAVHRYLHRRAGRDLADELAAETFALAFARRERCRATGSVLPWLYGIATNLLHRQRRAERRQLRAYSRSGVDRWVAYEDEADARVDGAALDARLAGALAAMRPRSAMLCSSMPSQTSVTRRSLLHSTSRSERSARGSTGRVRPHNVNSKRQKWTFLRWRQQELI